MASPYLAPYATPTPMQERLLAALAARPDEIVPIDDLIAATGTTGVLSLRVHLKTLRRLLADGVYITCQHDTGYALIAGPEAAAYMAPRKPDRCATVPYTRDEDAYIRANWMRTTDADMGVALGRPTKSVAQRRSTALGLRRAQGGNTLQPLVPVPAPPKGISREAIKWAIANFHTHPEARVIAAMVAGDAR